MRSDKGKAFVLRRAGKSYREIHQELGMSVSTLSNWFKGVDFSEAIKSELTKQAVKKGRRHLMELNRVRGVALGVQYELAEKEALKELRSFRNIPLFVATIAAYWGEGHKHNKNQLRLTNTDPKMLHMFVVFLDKFCSITAEQLRLAIFIYNDLDEQKCKRYWSKRTGIKKFHKVQVLPGRHKERRLPYGTATVVVMNSVIARKMSIWIDHLPEMVLNTVPVNKKRP